MFPQPPADLLVQLAVDEMDDLFRVAWDEAALIDPPGQLAHRFAADVRGWLARPGHYTIEQALQWAYASMRDSTEYAP